MVRKYIYSRHVLVVSSVFTIKKKEWVWLYENKREKLEEAMKYEKDVFSWMEDENPKRVSSARTLKKK